MLKFLKNVFTLPIAIIEHLFGSKQRKPVRQLESVLKPKFFKTVKGLIGKGVVGVKHTDKITDPDVFLNSLVINTSPNILEYFTFQTSEAFVIINVKAERVMTIGYPNMSVREMEQRTLQMVKIILEVSRVVNSGETPMDFITNDHDEFGKELGAKNGN